MFCAAHRERDGAGARLDGGAHADSGAGIAGRQSHIHGRGVSQRVRENEPGDDGVRAGEPGLPCVDRGGRHRVDANRRGRIPARDQSGSGIFWRGAGHGDEDQSECDESAAQEHALHQRGDDGGTRALVGRNRRRPAAGINQLEGRKVGQLKGRGGASECALHRAGQPVAEHFTEVGRAGGGADLGVYFWRTARSRGSARIRIVQLAARRVCWRDDGVGDVGITRRDPMAMLPFCGYNMADYFRHWLEMGKKIPKPPKIFHVNWFRKGADGKFLWQGFGENVRALKWILERVEGRGTAQETPIGYVPAKNGLTLDGLKISDEALNELLRVNPGDWELELEDSKQFLAKFAERLPGEIREEHDKLTRRFQRVVTA